MYTSSPKRRPGDGTEHTKKYEETSFTVVASISDTQRMLTRTLTCFEERPVVIDQSPIPSANARFRVKYGKKRKDEKTQWVLPWNFDSKFTANHINQPTETIARCSHSMIHSLNKTLQHWIRAQRQVPCACLSHKFKLAVQLWFRVVLWIQFGVRISLISLPANCGLASLTSSYWPHCAQ